MSPRFPTATAASPDYRKKAMACGTANGSGAVKKEWPVVPDTTLMIRKCEVVQIDLEGDNL